MGLIKNEGISVGTADGVTVNPLPGDWKGTFSKVSNDIIYIPTINKDKRILVQGILQAVIQSQGLLLEPGKDYITKVKETTLDLVRFVEEHSK